MAAGLIDPRSSADIRTAVLALRSLDTDARKALRDATRDVNRQAVFMVRHDYLRLPPTAYARVYAAISASLRPLYTSVSDRNVTAGGIVAGFTRNGRQLVRQYEYGSKTGDLIHGRTRPKSAGGRRYARYNVRSEGRSGMTQFPTRSRYGWYVGASAYDHLDDIMEPWFDAVEQVLTDAVSV